MSEEPGPESGQWPTRRFGRASGPEIEPVSMLKTLWRMIVVPDAGTPIEVLRLSWCLNWALYSIVPYTRLYSTRKLVCSNSPEEPPMYIPVPVLVMVLRRMTHFQAGALGL